MALEDPLVDFRGHTTPDGHTYWVDKITGESSWRAPRLSAGLGGHAPMCRPPWPRMAF